MSSMYRALMVLFAAPLGACAAHPAPPIRYRSEGESLALAEARAIEAAKRHPNAQPRVRPEYPEEAPPPLPSGQSLPEPLHVKRRAAPQLAHAAPSQVLVERTVYDAPHRYRSWYGYSYRRPWSVGVGVGWDPYWHGGSYYYPHAHYGYGYGIGLGFSTPLWRSHLGYSSWARAGHHHHSGLHGGFGGHHHHSHGHHGGHVRSVSGRRR